jgi:hypothetical protein
MQPFLRILKINQYCLRNRVKLNFQKTTVLVTKICIFNKSYHILFTFIYPKQKQKPLKTLFQSSTTNKKFYEYSSVGHLGAWVKG